jgi:ribosomal protein S4E
MELNYKKLVLDYLSTSMEHDNFNRGDFKVYSETTADGYEVYVATHDDQNVNIQDDVYYYDSDLADVIMEKLEDHYSVYIDENVEDIVNDIPDSFTKEELTFVKNEYLGEEEEIED